MHKTTIVEYRELLFELGLKKGDHIIVHADLRMFGKLEGGFESIIRHLLEIVGNEGTLITPAFTFSFPDSFDLRKSNSKIGGLTSLFAKHPNVQRVPDGMTSYYLIGSKSKEFIDNWDNTSYGENSIIGQMLKADGKILQFDTDILSLIHFVEQLVGVPYRELRRFEGKIIDDKSTFDSYTSFYCRTKNVDKIIPDPIRTAYYCKKSREVLFKNRISRTFQIKDFVSFAKKQLEKNRMILVR